MGLIFLTGTIGLGIDAGKATQKFRGRGRKTGKESMR
jgi:hypothetical protein